MSEALTERRKLLQPKRPRVDPARENVLADVNLHLYAPFARAMAVSATKDRSTPEGQRLLAALPHINHVAKEAQAFVAMLDFSNAVDRVLHECKKDHREPYAFWQKNEQQIQMALTRASAEFNRAIQPLHLTITASDPSLRTSEHYQAFVKAEQDILHAHTYGAVKHAQQALKAHAFEFILGGADKDADEVHHKLFTRIKEAYKADKALIRKREFDYERTRDSDREGPFQNPLTSNALHTMNRVYEARWALADDVLSAILQSNKRTVANPDVAPESAKPPRTEVTQVTRIRKPRKAATEKPNASAGYVGDEEVRRTSAKENGGKQGGFEGF